MKRWHALAALPVTALLALAPAAAGAATYTHHDAKGDVLSQSLDASTWTAVPTRTDGDVTDATTDFRRHSLRLRMRYAGSTSKATFHVFDIRTSGRLARAVLVTTDARHPHGMALMLNRHDQRVRCAVSTHVTTSAVSVVVPGRCLGAARWVRVGMGAASVASDTAYEDDALLDGTVHDEDLHLGPRVRRG